MKTRGGIFVCEKHPISRCRHYLSWGAHTHLSDKYSGQFDRTEILT